MYRRGLELEVHIPDDTRTRNIVEDVMSEM